MVDGNKGGYMGILSKLFGRDPETQKRRKFQELERKFAGDPEEGPEGQELVNFMKASWLTSRASAYGRSGNLEQATLDLKEAIRLQPDYTPAYIHLGLIYREKGLLREALAVLTAAPLRWKIAGKEHGGSEFEVYNAIGTVYLLMGAKDKVLEYAKKALAAVNDPERKELKEIAKRAGVINEDEADDSQIVGTLKELIQELERKH